MPMDISIFHSAGQILKKNLILKYIKPMHMQKSKNQRTTVNV